MIEYDSLMIKGSLDRYLKIMEFAKTSPDISKDREFQKTFNGFYIAGPKSQLWYQQFYELFQEAREHKYDFKTVLFKLYDTTGRVELSFCSKMIHTLNPQKPIIDQYILWKLGFNTKINFSDNPDLAVSVYDDICKQYNEHMNDDSVVEVLKRFDNEFPQYANIEKIKKLDTIFWSRREFRIHSVFEYEAK